MRVGVLVVRVWTEGKHRLRSRITSCIDIAEAVTRTSAAGTVNDISAAVTKWFEEFHGVAEGDPPHDGRGGPHSPA